MSVAADASSSVLAVWTATPLTGEDSTAARGNLGVGMLSLFFFFFSSRADAAGRSVMFPQTQIQTSAASLAERASDRRRKLSPNLFLAPVLQPRKRGRSRIIKEPPE